jgi:uncharacterized surface protein with fasciclin (FAS1) repeats
LEVVLESKDHTTLAALAGKIPAVVELLKSAGPLTLFAPTDAAFAKLPKAVTDAVTKDDKLLATVLTYHAIAGAAFDPAKAEPQTFAKTVLGQTLGVTVKDKSVTLAFGLNNSKVTASVNADNGVVHVVDTVLTPLPTAAQTAVDAGLKQLVAALTKAKLVEAVNGAKDVTIFAPSEKAFENLAAFAKKNNLVIDDALLTEVLKLHVVPKVVYSTDIVKAKTVIKAEGLNKLPLSVQLKDGSVLVAGEGNTAPAKVEIADVLYDNGVVHVIDTVLLPKLDAKPKETGKGYEKPKETAKDYKPAPTKAPEAYGTNIVSGAASKGFALASMVAAFFVL